MQTKKKIVAVEVTPNRAVYRVVDEADPRPAVADAPALEHVLEVVDECTRPRDPQELN